MSTERLSQKVESSIRVSVLKVVNVECYLSRLHQEEIL